MQAVPAAVPAAEAAVLAHSVALVMVLARSVALAVVLECSAAALVAARCLPRLMLYNTALLAHGSYLIRLSNLQ